jgi:hypothetical protein
MIEVVVKLCEWSFPDCSSLASRKVNSTSKTSSGSS